MLKGDILSTACELTMSILSISVITFKVTCLTVTSLITNSRNVGQYILVHFTRLCTSRFQVGLCGKFYGTLFCS